MRKPHRPRRPDATGRTQDKTAAFVKLPHRVRNSAAYAGADLVARALLEEVVFFYNGSNNGEIFLSTKDATALLSLGDEAAVVRGFNYLMECGLLDLAKTAHFEVKTAERSRARCWRIPWEAWPESKNRVRRAPCWDFEHYQPPAGKIAQRADRRLRALAKYRKDYASGRFAAVKSLVTEPKMPRLSASAAREIPADNDQNDAIPPIFVAGDSPVYIQGTMGTGASWWWRNDTEAVIGAQLALLLAMTQNRPPLAVAA